MLREQSSTKGAEKSAIRGTTVPALELLTFLNFATPTLSRKSEFVGKLKKIVDKDQLLRIERECFKTALPATVSLPAAMRENSVVLTSIFFLLGQKQGMSLKETKFITERINHVFGKDMEDVLQSLQEEDYSINACEVAFSICPEIVALVFVVFSFLCQKAHFHILAQNIWLGYRKYITLDDDDQEEAAGIFAKKRDGFVGSQKSFGDYWNLWETSEKLSNPKKTLSTNPISLFTRAAICGGVAPLGFITDATLVTKEESEVAARCAAYAQNANVDFDIDHFKKEYVQMPEARVDYHKAFLFAIMVRKAAAFYSQDVLEALKQKIFGDEKQQAIFDKQLKSLHEAKELAQKLEKENILLREKANEVEVQKEAVKKREYALKEQIMLLTKRLENAEMCIRKMREESFQDEEAPILTADLNAALKEAGFEPLEKSRKKNFQNELTAYERQYRIVIAGGNENLMKRFRTKHPNIVLLNNTRLGNCDAALRNADILFFKTDCISHSLYDKCKDIAHAKKIPCEYIPEITSIGAIEQTICKKIAEKIDVKEGSEGCA